jgi:glycosyltransferase involved in cell wall biosynthesis
VRVAWEVTPLSVPPTGIGRYILGSLDAMALARPDWDLRAVAVAEQEGIERIQASLAGMPANVTLRPTVKSPAWFTRRLATDLRVRSLERFSGDVDAFIDSEWFRPRQQGGVRLAIVYDVIPLLFPEWVSPRTRKAHLRSLKQVSHRADRIISISEVTKRDLVEHLGISPERISIAYPGVGEEYLHAAPVAPPVVQERPYIVVVGATNARKNLLRMLEAFALVAKAQSDLDLVVVGAADVDEPAIREAVERLGVADHVHRLGYVSDQELAGVVAAARLLVFPSLYEGFGMPVVEAMAAGVPVAASANSSLDEACGEAAARFDPLDVEAIASTINGVLSDAQRAEALIAGGRTHAAGFTWPAAGEQIAKAIEETVV